MVNEAMGILLLMMSGLLFCLASLFAYVISGDPAISWQRHSATPVTAVIFIYSMGFAIAGVLWI